MSYSQAHYCAAFAHSVPAYITYCYGIALTNRYYIVDPKERLMELVANQVPPKIPPLQFQCPMKHSASGFFPLVLCCEKFDTLHGKAVNALHQRFSRNIIFTATTLDLKHILSINDAAIPDPQPLWGADFMFSVAHLLTASFVLV